MSQPLPFFIPAQMTPPLRTPDVLASPLALTLEAVLQDAAPIAGPSQNIVRFTTPPQLLSLHPTPSVCVALFRAGTSGVDVLLHLRKDNGLWGLPGGAVEHGESLADAARREMEEETGLTDLELRSVAAVHSDPATGAVFAYPDGTTTHYVCLTVVAWIADWERSGAQLRGSAESQALMWFGFEASQGVLPEPFSPVHRTRLAAAWAALRGTAAGLALG